RNRPGPAGEGRCEPVLRARKGCEGGGAPEIRALDVAADAKPARHAPAEPHQLSVGERIARGEIVEEELRAGDDLPSVVVAPHELEDARRPVALLLPEAARERLAGKPS